MKGIYFYLHLVNPNISSHVASQILRIFFWPLVDLFFFLEVCVHLVCSIHKLHHCRYCSVESCFVNFLCDLQTKIIHDNRSSVTISQSQQCNWKWPLNKSLLRWTLNRSTEQYVMTEKSICANATCAWA